MSQRLHISPIISCLLKTCHAAILAAAAFGVVQLNESSAQPPTIGLTQVGAPIWRPVDFQLFSAPGYTDEDDERTRAMLRPLDPPGETYTTPHGPPYDSELSTNMAAAGFVSRSVFPREAIMGNPNVIFHGLMLVPDPGVTGSSRDLASGPVIPNSLFPLTGHLEVWKDGALIWDPGDGPLEVRPTDQPYEGSSHRLAFASYWNRGANNLGDFEFRSSFRDSQGNGWDFVTPFQVVAELPELAGDFNEDGAVDAADYVVWRNGLGTTYTQADYESWRTHFGETMGSRSALATPSSLPGVPEPSALLSVCIAAIGIGTAARRRTTRRAVSPKLPAKFLRNSAA